MNGENSSVESLIPFYRDAQLVDLPGLQNYELVFCYSIIVASDFQHDSKSLHFRSLIQQLDSVSLLLEVRRKSILQWPQLRPFLCGCSLIDLHILLVWRPLKDRQRRRNRYNQRNLELGVVLDTTPQDQSKKNMRKMSLSVLSTR